ncbi:MAG: hypothetical protein ABID54_06170 [Pseudomonadota bacterium]
MKSKMVAIHITMVIVGLSMICWGFWAAYSSNRPLDIIGGVFAPSGLVLALLGVLLICVPRFFSY